MNEMLVQENLDKFISTINQIKYSASENEGLVKINSYIPEFRESLNTLLGEFGYICTDILYTLNTDKEYFGVIINPGIDSLTAFKIFATSEPVAINTYQLELDSKMVESNGLSANEIASIIIYEITSTLNPGQIDNIRNLIDIHVLADDDVLHLRDSVNYNQLIVYAIKDTLYKISSILFKDSLEEVLSNQFIATLHLDDDLIMAQEKLFNNAYGINDCARTQKTVILQWVFMIYQDVQGYAATAIETLKDAKTFTASKLLGIEIDKTINAIDRVGNFTIKESAVPVTLNAFLESKNLFSINELGLFKSLKMSGLRSIEDDFYELSLQVKTIDTENDALYVLRAINSRLSVLEDYIYNNAVKESDKKHWINVAKQYRELRNSVLAKKISKRKYTDIFMDYNDFESDND